MYVSGLVRTVMVIIFDIQISRILEFLWFLFRNLIPNPSSKINSMNFWV